MDRTFIRTPLGTALVEGNEAGITRLTVGSEKPGDQKCPASLIPLCRQLKAYFEGNLRKFDVPLSPKGTDFQKKVWQALLEIPYGSTITYGDLASELGNPGAVRAVASANAQNAIWILIPCHRVIGSDGDLRGYAGGLSRKKWLLDHETGAKQYSLFPGEQAGWSEL